MPTSGRRPDVLVDTSVAVALSVADHEHHTLVVDALDDKRLGLSGHAAFEAEAGAAGVNWLLPDGQEEQAERLPDTCTIRSKAGDVLRMLTPGGGGWGTLRAGGPSGATIGR